MDAIFLDIDGVLATPLSDRLNALLRRMPFDQLFDPAALWQLRRLVHRTGAAVVLSSTWRDGLYIPECRPLTIASLPTQSNVLAANGTPICDATPMLYAGGKGREIAAWLARHPCRRFVILDDHDCFADVPALRSRWVPVPSATGLRAAQARRALQLLRGGPGGAP